MKYLGASFSVAVGSDDYRSNWDRIFKKAEADEPAEPQKIAMVMLDGFERRDVMKMGNRCPKCEGEGVVCSLCGIYDCECCPDCHPDIPCPDCNA